MKRRFLPLALLVVFACEPSSTVTPLVDEDAASDSMPTPDSQLAILDGTREGGNPGLFWLPPMVRGEPEIEGEFDESLLPFLSVEICEWDGAACVGDPIRTFTYEAEESEQLRISTDDDGSRHYIVNWHTGDDGLDPEAIYRISVKAGPVELGYADVDVVQKMREAASIDPEEFAALAEGRTLPVKFVVTSDLDAVALAGVDDAWVSVPGTPAAFFFPPGSLSEPTVISVDVLGSDVLPASAPVPADGAILDFGPDGIAFPEPVVVALTYDPSMLPSRPGMILRLHKLVGDEWVEQLDGFWHGATNSVLATVDGFSFYGLFWVSDPADTAPLSHTFRHRSVETDVGIWMFKDEALEADAISDWLDRTQWYQGQLINILEPINLVWVDYTSGTTVEAQAAVEDYLDEVGFHQEGFGHSKGYYGTLGSSWEAQWPGDATWVDRDWPSENNHGRVLGTYPAGTSDSPAFVTLGAFSREAGLDPAWVTACLSGGVVVFPAAVLATYCGFHDFVSFHEAQNAALGSSGATAALGTTIGDWTYERIDLDWGNVRPAAPSHVGVAVVVRGAPGPPSTGLIAHYPLDGGQAIDETGNGGDGTVSGAIATRGRDGTAGGALEFDGTGHVSTPLAPTFRQGESFSISAWFRTSTDQPDGMGIIGLEVTNNQELSLQTRSRQAYGYVRDDGPGRTTVQTFSGTTVDYDQWHHAVLVRDAAAGEIRLYLDEVLVDTQNDATTTPINGSSVQPFAIGAVNNSSLGMIKNFVGAIDEVKIFGEAVTTAKVDELCDVASVCDGATSSTLHFEDFSSSPGLTSGYTPKSGEFFRWDSVDEIYEIRITEENGAEKFTYGSPFSRVSTEAFTISADMYIEQESWGLPHGMRFSDGTAATGGLVINHTGTSSRFVIADVSTSTPSYSSSPVSEDRWYTITIEYFGDGTADIEMRDRSSGAVVGQYSGVDFQPGPFDRVAYGASTLNTDGTVAEIHYDNVSVQVGGS